MVSLAHPLLFIWPPSVLSSRLGKSVYFLLGETVFVLFFGQGQSSGSRSKTKVKVRGQLQRSRSTVLCVALDITSNKMSSCPSKIDEIF